jgi:hypothetical protein
MSAEPPVAALALDLALLRLAGEAEAAGDAVVATWLRALHQGGAPPR